MLVAADQRSVASHLLGSGPLYFLGVISHSIYMTHFALFIGVVAVFGLPTTRPLSFYPLVSLAVSTDSYLAIERPTGNAVRRFQCNSPAQAESA